MKNLIGRCFYTKAKAYFIIFWGLMLFFSLCAKQESLNAIADALKFIQKEFASVPTKLTIDKDAITLTTENDKEIFLFAHIKEIDKIPFLKNISIRNASFKVVNLGTNSKNVQTKVEGEATVLKELNPQGITSKATLTISKSGVALFLDLPVAKTLSTIIPGLKALDNLGLQNVKIIASSYDFFDEEMALDIKKGVMISGSISGGILQEIRKVVPLVPENISIAGLLSSKIEDMYFEAKINSNTWVSPFANIPNTPLLNDIAVRNLSLKISNPKNIQVQLEGESTVLKSLVKPNGITGKATMDIASKGITLWLDIAAEKNTLNAIPGIAALEKLGVQGLKIIASSYDFTDKTKAIDIKKGVMISGSLGGDLFNNIRKIIPTVPENLFVAGLITPDITNMYLEAKISSNQGIYPFAQIPELSKVPLLNDIAIKNLTFKIMNLKNIHAYFEGEATMLKKTVQPDGITGKAILDVSPKGITISLDVPTGKTLSAIIPKAKALDNLGIEGLSLIASSYDFIDEKTKINIKQGITIAGALGGQVVQSIRKAIPVCPEKLMLSGTITPDIANMNLEAKVDLNFDPFKLAGLKANFLILDNLLCRITGSGSIDFSGQVRIKPSDKDDTLIAASTISIQQDGLKLGGKIENMWKNPFGALPGFSIGNLAFELAIIYGDPPVPSGFGLAGEVEAGTKHVKLATKIDVKNLTKIVLVGEISGKDPSLGLSDIVDLLNKSGIKVNTKNMPKLDLHDVDIYISPTETDIGGLKFNQGFRIKGKTWLFDKEGILNVQVGLDGIKAFGFLDEININNGLILITGIGHDGRKGPKMDIELSLARQLFALDSIVKVLGIEQKTLVNFDINGFTCQVHGKILNLYNSELNIESKFNKDFNVRLWGHLENTFSTYLQEKIFDEVKKINQKINDTKQTIADNIKKQIDETFKNSQKPNLTIVNFSPYEVHLVVRARAGGNDMTYDFAPAKENGSSIDTTESFGWRTLRAFDVTIDPKNIHGKKQWRSINLGSSLGQTWIMKIDQSGNVDSITVEKTDSDSLRGMWQAFENTFKDIAKSGSNFLVDAANNIANIVLDGVELNSKIIQELAMLTKKAIDIKKVSFDCNAKDIVNTSILPGVTIEGSFMGKEFKLKTSLDLNNLNTTVKILTKEIVLPKKN